jgi:hypothetical protein
MVATWAAAIVVPPFPGGPPRRPGFGRGGGADKRGAWKAAGPRGRQTWGPAAFPEPRIQLGSAAPSGSPRHVRRFLSGPAPHSDRLPVCAIRALRALGSAGRGAALSWSCQGPTVVWGGRASGERARPEPNPLLRRIRPPEPSRCVPRSRRRRSPPHHHNASRQRPPVGGNGVTAAQLRTAVKNKVRTDTLPGRLLPPSALILRSSRRLRLEGGSSGLWRRPRASRRRFAPPQHEGCGDAATIVIPGPRSPG